MKQNFKSYNLTISSNLIADALMTLVEALKILFCKFQKLRPKDILHMSLPLVPVREREFRLRAGNGLHITSLEGHEKMGIFARLE